MSLKIERFDTSNHPAIAGNDNKTEEVKIRLTHNKIQILKGLSNILECKMNAAVRIELYTIHNKDQVTPKRISGEREGGQINRVNVVHIL